MLNFKLWIEFILLPYIAIYYDIINNTISIPFEEFIIPDNLAFMASKIFMLSLICLCSYQFVDLNRKIKLD